MLNKDKNLKLYYSISEVAQLLGVNESLLRYWEDEFPQQLKPKRAGRGVRQYNTEDIEALKLIYHLVKERGMQPGNHPAQLRGRGTPEEHPRRTGGHARRTQRFHLQRCGSIAAKHRGLAGTQRRRAGITSRRASTLTLSPSLTMNSARHSVPAPSRQSSACRLSCLPV